VKAHVKSLSQKTTCAATNLSNHNLDGQYARRPNVG